MRSDIGNKTGLTLVEVMAVLAISGILLVGMWQLYHGSMRTYQRGLRDVRVTQRARTVMRILTRDIQQALGTALPYGIRGTDHRGPLAEADRMELTTITYPTMPTDRAAARLQQIHYVLEPTGGTLTLKRVSAQAQGQETGRVMPLGEQLHSLNVRYFDGQMWYDSWQQASRPRALELTVKFRSSGWDARTYGFTTVVSAD